MPALARPGRASRIPVTSLGSGSDSDRSTASTAAKENAESTLVCAGRLENVHSSVSGCVQTGDGENATYVCTAVARATCVIGE
jgi:hypothetical protein